MCYLGVKGALVAFDGFWFQSLRLGLLLGCPRIILLLPGGVAVGGSCNPGLRLATQIVHYGRSLGNRVCSGPSLSGADNSV